MVKWLLDLWSWAMGHGCLKIGKWIWICWLVGAWGACRPADKSLPATAGLEDTTALTSQVDSTRAIGQDGLDYQPLNTGTFRQLPPELTALLNEEYPGWVLPEIPADSLNQVDREAQGPYYVSADFDRNGLQDYAVQFQIRDSTLVAAYLRQAAQSPLKFILARQPLARKKGESQSPLVVSRDSVATKIRIRLTHQGRRQDTQVFVFKGGMFSVVTGKDREQR